MDLSPAKVLSHFRPVPAFRSFRTSSIGLKKMDVTYSASLFNSKLYSSDVDRDIWLSLGIPAAFQFRRGILEKTVF